MQKQFRWSSILVRGRCFEGGVKIPSKGISMKFLAFAKAAQACVGAGKKNYGYGVTAYALNAHFSLRLYCVGFVLRVHD